MEFFVFLLFLALIFLYNSNSKLKRTIDSIQLDLEKNFKQNRFLKSELEALKSLIDPKSILPTKELVSEKEEIIEKTPKVIESITASTPEIEPTVEISAKENSADFIAITDIPVSKSSVTIAIAPVTPMLR